MLRADFSKINKTVVPALYCATKGSMGMGGGRSTARLSPQAKAWMEKAFSFDLALALC